jgi:hypothetical protein
VICVIAAAMALCIVAAPAQGQSASTTVHVDVASSISVSAGCGPTLSLGTVNFGSTAIQNCTITVDSTNPAGTRLSISDSSNTWGMQSGANTIADYASGVNDWDQGGSFLGACLEQVTDMDALRTMQDPCTNSDADPWFGMSTIATNLAVATTPGVSATAVVAFGAQVIAPQQDGVYVDTVTFTVVAL